MEKKENNSFEPSKLKKLFKLLYKMSIKKKLINYLKLIHKFLKIFKIGIHWKKMKIILESEKINNPHQ